MKNEILSKLPAGYPWRETLHWFDTIDSTNTKAKQLAAEAAPSGTALLAGHQSAGRGRLGRSFSSPQGKGLYLSLILRPNCKPEALMHLTCAVAVAACQAVADVVGIRPGIKWINDLVVGKRKLGGILTELSIGATGHVDYAIIGIGINCTQAPSDFPEEIQDIATSLSIITGKEISLSELSAAMLTRLHQMDTTLLTEKSQCMAAYKENCITLGKPVMLCRADQIRYGTALDLNEEGQLLVELEDGTQEWVYSGEASIRGMYGYV